MRRWLGEQGALGDLERGGWEVLLEDVRTVMRVTPTLTLTLPLTLP